MPVEYNEKEFGTVKVYKGTESLGPASHGRTGAQGILICDIPLTLI